MYKSFEEPELVIHSFDVEDILTTSDWEPGVDELPGDPLSL